MANKHLCRKCKKRRCDYYGAVGGFSVQCKICNIIQGLKRNLAAARLRLERNRAAVVWERIAKEYAQANNIEMNGDIDLNDVEDEANDGPVFVEWIRMRKYAEEWRELA